MDFVLLRLVSFRLGIPSRRGRLLTWGRRRWRRRWRRQDGHSDDEVMTEDGWDGRRSSSFGSDSSLSTIVLDAAAVSDTNDLAAQVGLSTQTNSPTYEGGRDGE